MNLNEIHEKLGSAETTKDYLKLYCDLFKLLSKKQREDNGAFLSVTPLVSKALVDLNIQDAELQQRILLSLGLLLCKNNPVELPMSLQQQAMKDVVNVLMVTADKSVTFRSFWCLSQFVDAGLEMEEPMVLHILKSIESVQSSCMRNVALYGEACGLLQKMIEKNIDGLFKHVKSLAKLVFTPVFHPVSKIREISYKTLQLATPVLQSGNDNTAAPVGAVVLDLVKKMLDDMLHLFRNKNEIYVLEVWKTVVNILGQSLHKNVNAINGLLSIVEKGFKHESQDVKLKSFDAWKTLVSNFALSEEVICLPKKLRLLLQPLLRISSTKTEAVIQAKCDTWWHIAWSLGDKIPNHFELVCLPLLEFVCGTSFKDNGEVAVLQQTTVYSSSQQRIMKQKGCEILIRFLEQPLSGTFLHSPKKVPTISIPPLRKPVSAAIFPKFPKEFVKATGAVIKEFGKEPEMLSHIDYLLKLLLFAITTTTHDANKDCIDAIASFVQLVVDIVKCQLCPPLLCSKLVDKVSQLPKKMLTAHYYYVGNTGVMHGNLYLTILSLLLHPTFLTMPDFKHRVVPLFQRLAGSSIKSTLSPLSYAHSIVLFMKEQTVINNCDAEVLLNLWSAVSSALFAAVQETLEISGGTCFEQDFACMFDVLTYPFEYVVMLNTSQGQFKTILTKFWGDLYKLFYRCSALLPSTDNNSACDGICSQLLKCLSKDNIENSSVCEVLSYILPVIVECVDFDSVGKNGKGGFSAERWAKSKQNQLGNIAHLIDVIKWFLTYFHETMSSESSNKDKDAQQSTIKFAVMYLEILNTFISKISSSRALSAVLDQLAEPLSKVYEFSRRKNLGTKKNVHTFLTQLEILWKTITTNIQVHYTDQYDSDFLQVLSPLLEVNLRHQKQEIRDRTRQFWFASFAPNQSKLEFPPTLREVLKKLRPPLLPGSDTSPIEGDSPFTDLTEDQTVLVPPPKGKEEFAPLVANLSFSVTSSPAQNTRKTNENNSPSVKTKRPSKTKSDKVSIDDLPEEEFVEIKLPPTTKKILTRRQKEAKKKKSYVPALYSELSQNSCSIEDTLDTQDSCSVMSVSQDEPEISVIGQFHNSVEVHGKQIPAGEETPATFPSAKGLEEKGIVSSASDGNGEKGKPTESGSLRITKPTEPVAGPLEQTTESKESNKDVLNCPGNSPEVQVMEIEVIDVDSQCDSCDTGTGGIMTSEQGIAEKETSASSCDGKVHREAADALSVKSVAEVSESVITEGPDLQNLSMQQVIDAAAGEKNSEMKDLSLCDNVSKSALPENEPGGNVECSSSEGGETEDLNTVTDSEEIIPSSQSSSEGDFDIPKDSSLLYRFKSIQKTPVSVASSVPHVVFCSKTVSDSNVASSDDAVSAKAARTSVSGKGISGDKLNGSPVVISAGKINITRVEHTGSSEKSDVIPDSKVDGNISMTETVTQESLPNGCESDSERIDSAVEETRMETTDSAVGETKMETTDSAVEETKMETTDSAVEETRMESTDGAVEETRVETTDSTVEETRVETTDSAVEETRVETTDSAVEETRVETTAAPISVNEVCDYGDKGGSVLSALSKDDVKKKLYAESRDDNIVHSDISHPNNEGKSNTANGQCSDSLAKGKKYLKIDKNTEKPSSPKKTVNKTGFSENIPKSKSSQNAPIIISVGSESCYIKTRRQVFQHSPLLTRSKLKSSNVTTDVFSINSSARRRGSKKGASVRSPKKNAEDIVTQNSVSENPGCIYAASVTGVKECLSVGKEPEKCGMKEDVQNINCSSEIEESGNSDVGISEEVQSNIEVKSVSSICVDVEINKSEIHTKTVDDVPENLTEARCDIGDNSAANNLNTEAAQICGSGDNVLISAAVHDAKENELSETSHVSDNTVFEKLCTSSSHSDDKSGDSTVIIAPIVEEKKLVSCNIVEEDGISVDKEKSSEISQFSAEVSEHRDKPCEHSNASCKCHTVIHETENLVSDKETTSHNCEITREELSADEKNLICSEKNNQIKVMPVIEEGIKLDSDGACTDENDTPAYEGIFQPVLSEKSESDGNAPQVENKSNEVPIPVSPSYVMNSMGSVDNEINPDSNKSVQISEDTNDSSESATSHNMHEKQIHQYNHHTTVNNCAAPSAEQVAVCLEAERQSDKACTHQEKETDSCENAPSNAHHTAPNEMNSFSPSHKVTVINLSIQESNKAVKEHEIQVNNLPSLERSAVSEEIPGISTEMKLTEVQKDSCERTATSVSLQNDLSHEKVIDEGDSTHEDLTLEKLKPNNDPEANENDQANDSTQDCATQSSLKLNCTGGSDSPSKKIDNRCVSAVSAASVSHETDIKPEASGVFTFVGNHNCDNELSLPPCSGAKKRKQKTPSNSCIAIDIKRKKLELRSKKDVCEKFSSTKQICSENIGLERLASPAKHSKMEDASLPSKAGLYNESNDCTKTVPDKFMQLWHSSIVLNIDDNMTVQEKKQKLPPEKFKNSSSNGKSNQSDFEADRTVSEEVKVEETSSSSSVLRDVRNSPLQWRSSSSSVISIPVSPLSRSQRMVRAARKHMNSPDTVKQNAYSRAPRTALLDSPSTSKTSASVSESSKVSSPVYSSILKKRTHDGLSTPSPPLKKRKVSFADPLVQGEMIIEPCDNENSCRARRSAKRCLQMNRDNSQRSKRKFFWCNQDQEKYPNLKKSQRFSNKEIAKMSVENSGTTFENGHNQEKLEVSEIKKEQTDEIVKGKTDVTRSEQNIVILGSVNESTCPPPVAFSTSQLSPTSSLTSSDIPSSDVYENSEDFNCDSQAIVFEELVHCSESVNSIIPLLTSPMWVRGLSQLLLSRKINTIGDLSGLTVEKLKALPIKSPKLETVQNILKDYALQRLKSSSHKLNTASPSSPKSCNSSGEKTEVTQTSADYQEDFTVSVDRPAIQVEPGERLESVNEIDSTAMQVDPCGTSNSPSETDSQGQLGEEHDKEKCRELIAKLCNSQVIQEMPLVLLCDLLMKITNGIKAKSCQKPQEDEK